MMKKLYIWLCSLISALGVAQQLPQYSQYLFNQMAINPAYAGTNDYSEVRSNNRQQWVGITDAPRTYMLTLEGPIKDKNMGLGMNLFTDVVGPTRRTGLNFSYAYHLKLKKEMFLSMGLSAGILQWGIDGSKLILHDTETDPNLLIAYQTKVVPDFGAGLYFHKKDQFYFGFSVPQLYQAPIPLYPGAGKNSKLVNQFNFNGAYKFKINDDFKVEPSFLLKIEVPAPAKLDLGARVLYKEQVWIGAAYRSHDAFTMLVGYFYQDYLTIGYSYDISTTNIKKYSSGSHEIMLGIRFSRKQAATWEKPKGSN